MSISHSATPRPEITIHTPPSSEKLPVSPNLIRKRPPIPLRSNNYTTTTFHSNPYPITNPIRRRRTETVFTFEMGPSFSNTKQYCDLYSMDQTNSYQVQLHAKMDRGFFKADQDWTCYRRNYFQVSATFDMHGLNYPIQGMEVPCLMRRNDTQELVQVDHFSIGISARVTVHDKKIDLVQHTPKRDKGPQRVPEPRPVRAGGNLHLASVGTNHNIVTFERLQFKTATANNGKRRAAQQYYEIVVDLYVNITQQQPIRVASCTSAPLVVRGRSPGHYSDSYTRFRNIEADVAPQNGTVSPVPAINPEERYGINHSPNRRYPSLPNSPISDFGPYSPYNNYPYPMTGYPNMMAPQSAPAVLPQFPSQSPPNYYPNNQNPSPTLYNNTGYPTEDTKKPISEQKKAYWDQPEAPRIGHLHENSSHYSSSAESTHHHPHEPLYMGTNPYGHVRHDQSGPYTTVDAGRLE
ncbi:hypothetical protein BDB01DRAFT_851933 [Pilobolus umbonatus]|nr:hypothetical protein BDB01DRAFT_851933 [Pilobolus umbonatus]